MSKPRKLLENRDAWGIVLGYLAKVQVWDIDQVADLKKDCKQKRIPEELGFLDEALQVTLNPEGLSRAAVLTEAFNIPRPLNPNEGWKIYLECYAAHKLSLQLFLAAFVMGGNKAINQRVNLLPVEILLDNIEEITAMLADDPHSQKFNIQLQLACIQKQVPDLALELNRHGATPPDFKEVFDTVCDEKSGLTIHPSTVRVMNALIKDPMNSFERWFLQNRVLAELYIIRVVMHLHEATRVELVDKSNDTARRHKELYQQHLSHILGRHNYHNLGLLIYNILLDPMIQTLQEDKTPTSARMFSKSSVFAPEPRKMHDRFDHQHFIAACTVISYLMREHKFPELEISHISQLVRGFEYELIVSMQNSKHAANPTVIELNAVLKIQHRKELAESSKNMLETALILMFRAVRTAIEQEKAFVDYGLSSSDLLPFPLPLKIGRDLPHAYAAASSQSWACSSQSREKENRAQVLHALTKAIEMVEHPHPLEERPVYRNRLPF